MKATRTDVARMAGVSTATVSNVLNNSDKVKEETMLRVLDAMSRLNYQPNMIARSLSTRKTMQIGLILEDARNPYYGGIIQYFESRARENGYFVNICVGTSDLDDYWDNFVSRGLDGAFVTALPCRYNLDNLYRLLENDIKLVVSGNINTDFRRISSIENDYPNAMRQAIAYLAELGHEDIAYLSGLGRELNCDLRCGAYLEQMEKLGFACRDGLLVDGSFPYATNVQAGYSQAVRLMESGKRFTAAVCGNDLMAIGAIRAFREKGLRIPEDVSVMGFDGIAMGRYITPALTTMEVDAKTFGEKAFDLLYTNMVQDTTGFYLNKLRLVEGESTARRR